MSRPRGTRGRFVSKAMITNGFSDENPRACQVCGVTETTQWRSGPRGESLCNADGIRAARAERTARVRARHHRSAGEGPTAAPIAADFPASYPSNGQNIYTHKTWASNPNTNPYLIPYGARNTNNRNIGSDASNLYCHNSKGRNDNTSSRITKHQRFRQPIRRFQSVTPNHALGPSLFPFRPSQLHGLVANSPSDHSSLGLCPMEAGNRISLNAYPLLDVNKESRNYRRDLPRNILNCEVSSPSPFSSGPALPSSPVSSSPDSLRTSSCHNVCSLSNLLN
jgi:hypothetical protein